MSKFKVAFSVLLIATTIWAIAFCYTLQGYHEYCEWFDEQPWSKWALREPYYEWNNGQYVIFTGGFLLVSWISFAGLWLSERISRRKKTILPIVVFLLLILIPAVMQIRHANATWLEESFGPTTKIGLLICYDPEFIYGHTTLPFFILQNAITALGKANWRYAENFGIEFINDDKGDWIEWDSYESSFYNPVDLLQDAIEQTGFQSGMMYNGKRRDMLLAFTGKDMYRATGIRYPAWNACIVEYNFVGSHWDEILQHELCIFCEDCPDASCIMNGDILNHLYPPTVWCEPCFQEVNSHKFRYSVVGDVNGDYKVNILDLSVASGAYGSEKGDANWVPSCDMNGDRKINIIDLNAIAVHYGESRY